MFVQTFQHFPLNPLGKGAAAAIAPRYQNGRTWCGARGGAQEKSYFERSKGDYIAMMEKQSRRFKRLVNRKSLLEQLLLNWIGLTNKYYITRSPL